MRKTCGQPWEIPKTGCGIEHKLCTKTRARRGTMRTTSTVFAQVMHGASTGCPQPKTLPFSLFSIRFSPLSTRPINTITIHIN